MFSKKASIKTIFLFIALVLLLIVFIPSGNAPVAAEDELFAYTSFEEPTTGSQYFDTGNQSTDHPLVNNPGQMPVNYTSTGGEIGFSAYYYNTREGVGLTDGDYFGVTSYTGQVGSFTSGSQGYEMTDLDGAVRLSFDPVDLSAHPTSYFGLDYYIIHDDYETSPEDNIRIWLVLDGGIELDLLDTRGSDIDDLGIEGVWSTVTAETSGSIQATLHIELDSNAVNEGLYIDNVRFSATPVEPVEPASCETIMEIQGTGTESPCVSRIVENITGCITGVAANGFYMQHPSGDGDPETSNGIYAYFSSSWENSDGLAPGQLVEVDGYVVEYYGTTEISHRSGAPLTVTQITTCDLPTPVTINPLDDPTIHPTTIYEPYESMRAQMRFDGWVVGATKRYNSRFENDDPEIAFIDLGSTIPDYSRIFEDDYPGNQGINYQSGALDRDLPDVDFGDRIQADNLTGVFSYQYGKWTLFPDATDPVSQISVIDRADVQDNEPLLADDLADFDVCFFNVKNLFDHIDDDHGDWGDWAPGYPISGSQDGLLVYQSKLDRLAGFIVTTMRSCILIGVEEVEGKQAVYDDLASAISNQDGNANWSGVYVESGDPRDISQGFLMREDVELVTLSAVSGELYEQRLDDENVDFVRTIPHGQFRFLGGTDHETYLHVYTAHFKSKLSSSSCSTPDCTDVREKEAADLRDLLAYHNQQGEYAIAGGDFNDFMDSSPIEILEESNAVQGLFQDIPESDWWTYIYNGESEVLDHMYVTSNLANNPGWEILFSPVHGQADFPSTEQASDHDALRAIFRSLGVNNHGFLHYLPSLLK